MTSGIDGALRARAREFWRWFAAAAPALAEDVENPRLVEELDRRVRTLDSRLSWEVGPGQQADWQLVISPNLDRDLLPTTKALVADAPRIEGWEVHPARLEKDWDFKVLLDADGDRPAEVDASGWRFVLLRHPDGEREVLLHGDNVARLDDDARSIAAAIALESLVGEEYLLAHIDSFELSDSLEPRLAAEARPIRELPSALGRRG